MTTLLIFVTAYFALLAVLSLVAQSYRLRLKAACEHLLDKASLCQDDVKMVEATLSSAYSIRTAPMLLLVFMTGILRSGQQIDSDADRFDKEHPTFNEHLLVWHEMLETHMVSAFAVNPIFGSLAYIAKWIFRAKARAYICAHKAGSKEC